MLLIARGVLPGLKETCRPSSFETDRLRLGVLDIVAMVTTRTRNNCLQKMLADVFVV